MDDPATRSIWQPLFSGAAAAPYQQAVHDIVERLESANVDTYVEHRDTDCGLPLMRAYLAEAGWEGRTRADVTELVDRMVEALASQARSPALYGGFAEVGWLAAHIDGLFGRRDDEAFEELDAALLAVSADTRTRCVCDLVAGPVGFGVYFLERLPHPRAVEGLTAIVDLLARSAVPIDDQIAWHVRPMFLSAAQREVAPDGFYNLGVAHGVPGVIGLLGEIRRAGIAKTTVDRLLSGAIPWTLSHQRADGTFASWVTPDVASDHQPKSRVSWCYGELGLALTLLSASRALAVQALEERALEVALRAAARRDHERTIDAGLCHGAAGNGHLFNRLYQATRRHEFLSAATFWFNLALEMRRPGNGIGGYLSWRPKKGGALRENTWQNDASFLTGTTGIALAFAAAISAVEPNWDRLLLARLHPS